MNKLLLLLAIMLLLVPQAPAAFTPASMHGAASSVQPKPATVPIPRLAKSRLVQQVAQRLAQNKRFAKWMARANDKQRTKDTMSIIALVAGILLALSIITVPVAALVLAPLAVVGGIIGVTKNPNRKSYTYALIGLILGLVYVALLALLLALAIAWSNGW